MRRRFVHRRLLGRALGMTAALTLAACAGILGYDRAELTDTSDADGASDASATPRDDGQTSNDAGVDAKIDTSDAAPYAAFVLRDQPIGYWRLDDPAGSATAKDELGKQNATVLGNVTFIDGGQVGRAAIYASDPSATLSVGSSFNLQGNYSVEMWVKPQPLTSQFTNLALKHLSNGDVGFALYFRHDTSDVLEYEQHFGTDAGRACAITITIRPAEFTHVVLTYDAAAKARMYINGAFVTPIKACIDAAGSPGTTTQPFQWGMGYVGLMDELALYDHALTGTQVAEHFSVGKR